MEIVDFFELFFVITAGITMPFIVIGGYFTLIPYEERRTWFTVLFLIISIVYALFYTYFSWKSIQRSESWKRIVKEEKKTEDKKDK